MKPDKPPFNIIAAGPIPPPEHGTSIPFRELLNFLGQDEAIRLNVVNTQSGDKTGASLLSRKVVLPAWNISCQWLRGIKAADCAIVYGSQRFCSSFGILHALASSYSKRPSFLYVQGGGFDVFYRSLNPLWRTIVGLAFRRYERVYLQTRLLENALSPHIPNVAYLPNWITSDWLNLPPHATPQPDRFRRFAFIGEIREEKGIGYLLEAFRMLPNHLQCTLSLYGPIHPFYREEFYTLLRSAPPAVNYHGSLAHKDVRTTLLAHDALVLPTHFPTEGYPGVILEAMSQKRLVVTSRWRAIGEIARDRETAVLCLPKDSSSLYSALSFAVTQDARCREIAKAGAALAATLGASSVLAPLKSAVLLAAKQYAQS